MIWSTGHGQRTVQLSLLGSLALLSLALLATPLPRQSAPVPAGASAPAPALAWLGSKTSAVSPPSAPPAAKQMAREAYAKLPLAFVPNRGQTDDQVRYYAQGAGHAFYFTRDRAVLSFNRKHKGVALELVPLGASPHARLEASVRRAGRVNYLVGAKRHANLPTFAKLTYHELWPGIDMVFRGTAGRLKYEFRLRPGADPSRIRLAYRGADGLTVGAAGDLLIGTQLGTLKDARPKSFQRVGTKRRAVASRYALHGATGYGFALGPSYDPSRPLVIDPGLAYSTYLGGSDNDAPPGGAGDGGEGIAVDAGGAAYVTGYTYSSDFPTTTGAYDTSYNGGGNVFVTKLNASGSALVYSTYLGVGSGNGIAVDASGAAYVTGRGSVPTTAGAYDTSYNGNGDAFVAKLDASGSTLVYATYLGGSGIDEGHGLAVDTSGAAYVTGLTESSDFPTSAGAYDTSYNDPDDAFVTKLNPSGSALAYSTFLGGSWIDSGAGIAVDASGAAYVTGDAGSSDFPTTAGAYDTSSNGGSKDAFVTKLNTSGSALAYSTYLGGSAFDYGSGIAVDAAGAAYVTGGTASSNFPTTAGANDTSYNGGGDVFVTKLGASGAALVYSTYLGGSSSETDYGALIAVDRGGAAYLTGMTHSSESDFPTTLGAYDTSYNGSDDAFLTKLDASGSVVIYSTFLGGSSADGGRGIAVDGSGAAYVTGYTWSSNFPTTAGAYDTSHNGSYTDAFVTKLEVPGTRYPRPKGASPLRVVLVPAYRECTDAATLTHGAPLSYPSCTPPALSSGSLTAGTPDANGQPANFTGFVRYGVVGEEPPIDPNNGDQADVLLDAQLTDVRKASDVSDYTGELSLDTALRITDQNSGSGGFTSATVGDLSLPATIPCAATASTSTGATCDIHTSFDALVPGVVKELKRAIWQLDQVRVYDGGPDGAASTDPNTLFATQGVFVP